MFIYVDIKEENLAKPFLTLFGLEESKNTVVSLWLNKNHFFGFVFISSDNCGN